MLLLIMVHCVQIPPLALERLHFLVQDPPVQNLMLHSVNMLHAPVITTQNISLMTFILQMGTRPDYVFSVWGFLLLLETP